VIGAMTALREQMGVPIHIPRRPLYERTIAAIRAAQTDAEFRAAWSAGTALTFEEAIACALESHGVAAPASIELCLLLSAREREVVHLLVEGRTNQEIASSLSISHYTVANHVRHIMNKLGLDSRTAVAAWAVRAGID
jgi:DNA-binding NarL/FixJ family response regulator